MFDLFSHTQRCFGYCGVAAEWVSPYKAVPSTMSYIHSSLSSGSGILALSLPVTLSQLLPLTVVRANLLISL